MPLKRRARDAGADMDCEHGQIRDAVYAGEGWHGEDQGRKGQQNPVVGVPERDAL